jgi:probable phosphoglycerate mutase
MRLVLLAERIDEVVMSPLLRSRQTAGVIAERLGAVHSCVADQWSEAHFGQWEGLGVPEVVERYPGRWEEMIADPAVRPPGGDSLLDVRERVLSAWRSAVVPGRTTLVVTHLTPIRIVVAEALGTRHEAFPRVFAAPGSITVLDRWQDWGTAVIAVGERPVAAR